jgi:hypothetical protein
MVDDLQSPSNAPQAHAIPEHRQSSSASKSRERTRSLSPIEARFTVVGLVYVAAVAPDAGETVQDQLDKYPSDIFTRVEVADGRAWMLPNGTEFFAGDLSAEEQKLVWPPIMRRLRSVPPTEAERRSHCVEVEAELVCARYERPHRAPRSAALGLKAHGATVTEVASSHVPMLSQPDVVIDVIRKAAAAVQNG